MSFVAELSDLAETFEKYKDDDSFETCKQYLAKLLHAFKVFSNINIIFTLFSWLCLRVSAQNHFQMEPIKSLQVKNQCINQPILLFNNRNSFKRNCGAASVGD